MASPKHCRRPLVAIDNGRFYPEQLPEVIIGDYPDEDDYSATSGPQVKAANLTDQVTELDQPWVLAGKGEDLLDPDDDDLTYN